jgi:peptide/nickel transport system permease protein
MTTELIPHPTTATIPTPPPRTGGSVFTHPFVGFFARRLLGAILTLFVVSVLIFLVLQVIPTDVASAVLGRSATPEALAALRADLGLDRPAIIRYLEWVGGLLHGDLGKSATALALKSSNPDVWGIIKTPLLNSVALAGVTVLLLIPLGLVFGAWAAVRARKPADRIISYTSLVFGSLPDFLIAIVLIAVFFSWLRILPPLASINPGETPFTHPEALILPVATLLAGTLSLIIRMVRAGVIDALNQDYVAMARLNGISRPRVISLYALRNSLAPAIQAIALTVAFLAGGIIVVESVFNYPGIGRTLVLAVGARDVTMVASITMLLAAFYIVVNIIADFLVVLLVPKLRTAL